MIIIANKIGNGTEDNPFRPETEYKSWQLIEERNSEFVIKILAVD
ncbi:hypothetical protein WKH57_00745 [Niallia taxi]